jgi:FkbM family methyltransferase
MGAGWEGFAPLILPGGDSTTIIGDERELSVFAPLRALNGDWEPHVRKFLERTVQARWVCLDIGANIGTHTLALARLACKGGVVAFEANPRTFEYLSRNVASLPAPKADIALVNCALWDTPGQLKLADMDALAGCSFVSPPDDVAQIEALIRQVINPSDIEGVDLHIDITAVPAVPLDSWLADNPLSRIDLIKIDVEGAEMHVLRGAERLLRTHAPILVTEYAPSCHQTFYGAAPEAYFHQLTRLFGCVGVIEEDGSVSPLDDWAALSQRLGAGKGWEDLACLPPGARPSLIRRLLQGATKRWSART